MVDSVDDIVDIPVLPESVPVTMPDLPPRLSVTTIEQFRASSDRVRVRILGIIQTQPATAKQIAERLGATPGAIGHHLHILEETGLAQVVARRLIRGVVAKYYSRTARLFLYDLPAEVTGISPVGLDILTQARQELAESLSSGDPEERLRFVAFPHVRTTPARAQEIQERLIGLLDELVNEPVDPDGETYGICLALFSAPAFLQTSQHEPEGGESTGA